MSLGSEAIVGRRSSRIAPVGLALFIRGAAVVGESLAEATALYAQSVSPEKRRDLARR